MKCLLFSGLLLASASAQAPGNDLLFAATAYSNNISTFSDVEILPLRDDIVCDEKPANYPMFGIGVAGAKVGDVHVTCGGQNVQGEIVTDCYTYDPVTNSWPLLANMLHPHYMASAVSMGEALWVTGGASDTSYDQKSTEVVYLDSGVVVQGSDLPVALSGHCMVRVDQRTTFIGGGHNVEDTDDDYRKAWLYHWELATFEELPEFTIKRKNHHCGLVLNSLTGSLEIIVQGGFQGSRAIQQTEIFNLTTKQWSVGNHSPIGNYGGSVVQDGGGFLVVGGDSDSGELRSTMRYNEDGEWSVLKQQTVVPRVFSTVALYALEDLPMCRRI